MKTRTLFCISIFIFQTFFVWAHDKDFSFFTTQEIENIRQSARTEWGKAILAAFRTGVEERLKHDLEVPTLEGGHGHHYCCPVHNVTFTFDWNKPAAHYCAACGKEYRGVSRYNWAWVNFVHAHNYGFMNDCMYLYLATGEKRYARYICDMLLDYAAKYPGYMVHDANRRPTEAFSGKMFGQSLDEAVWASDIARAYVAARPVMTPDEIKNIENGYLRECANLLLRRRDGGNWQVWHNSALAALGIALRDDSLVDVALNDTACGYRYLMRKHVYPDGWWNEGSPTYHFYPLRAMLLTAEAVRCRGIDLFDRRFYNMFAAPVLGTYPDLTFPSHNDGWYGESLLAQAPLYESIYAHTGDSLFLDVLRQCYRHIPRKSVNALLNPEVIAPAATSSRLPGHFFGNAGYALLRSDQATVVMKYGPHGGGHGHSDKLSVSIHNGTKEILPDFGTCAYGAPDYTRWYRKTLAHNTVTVDGKDQRPASGRLCSFTAADRGGSMTAEAPESYDGVTMERTLTLDGNRLYDLYTCTSDTQHQYDYVLLFDDKPWLTGKSEQAQLGTSEPFLRIKQVRKYASTGSFEVVAGNSEIKIRVKQSCEVFTGEASGVPPTNPGVKTVDGSEKRPVRPAYPLIIRVKDKSLRVEASWLIE